MENSDRKWDLLIDIKNMLKSPITSENEKVDLLKIQELILNLVAKDIKHNLDNCGDEAIEQKTGDK